MTKNAELDPATEARVSRHLSAASHLKAIDKARLAKAQRIDLDMNPNTGVREAVRSDDRGTPERNAKGDLYDYATDTTRSRRSGLESALDRYKRRHELDPRNKDGNYRLWHAGHKLRRAFRMSKFSPRVTANLLAAGGGGDQGEMTDAAADARAEYARAMRNVGPVLAPVLVHVVCLELGTAQEWAAEHAWAKRGEDGLPALRLALDAVARHYQL